MVRKEEKVISVLNNLIEICKDGEKGYREASEGIQNGYFQVLFSEYSRQRRKFASQLQMHVRDLGGEPDRKGSLVGTIHRGWMNLKSALDRNNDDLIVSECVRGEESALKNYEYALKQALPAEIKSLLEAHFLEIRATQRRVEAMKAQTVEKARIK